MNVNQFYGIEIEEFPAQIAQTALWLTDHQMNRLTSARFGQYFVRIPLKSSATIVNKNALETDWATVVGPQEVSFIVGNPPFLGARVMNPRQKAELFAIFTGVKNAGNLDYVTTWYEKAFRFIRGTKIEVAFVSTNSICQGQQVPILWKHLFEGGVHINFAHRTFKWSNEARGNAMVNCVIVGFALFERKEKHLFLYDDVKGEPKKVAVKNINAYLAPSKNIFIESRNKPICEVPPMCFGNVALDSGHLIFTEQQMQDFVKAEPPSKKYFKKLLGAVELLYNKVRYCLWLVDASPHELNKMQHVKKRIELVKEARLKARDKGANKLADRASQFRDTNNPKSFLAIPVTTGEARMYIPMDFFTEEYIPAVTIQTIENASVYEFAVLTSRMHMAWMRAVAGRLEMRYRYSKDVVYNNFVWPAVTEAQKKHIAELGKNILSVREKYLASHTDAIATRHSERERRIPLNKDVKFNSKQSCDNAAGYIYIVTNKMNTTLYIGVTNNLKRRIYEHKNHMVKGFTDKYNCEKLVYFEAFSKISDAIEREKYLKGKKREYKERLINEINPNFTDLYDYIFGDVSTPSQHDKRIFSPHSKAVAARHSEALAEESRCTLADLYSELTMPLDLRKAHEANDRAVDALYRKAPFKDDEERVAFLFDLYEKALM